MSRSRVPHLHDHCFLWSPTALHSLQPSPSMVCHILTLFFSIVFPHPLARMQMLCFFISHYFTLTFLRPLFMFPPPHSYFQVLGFDCHQQSFPSLTPVHYTLRLCRWSSANPFPLRCRVSAIIRSACDMITDAAGLPIAISPTQRPSPLVLFSFTSRMVRTRSSTTDSALCASDVHGFTTSPFHHASLFLFPYSFTHPVLRRSFWSYYVIAAILFCVTTGVLLTD